MKQSINAAKIIQGKWRRHKLYEQLEQLITNQRYKRQGEKPFKILSYLEAKLGAKEFNRRVKKLNESYYGLYKDHFNEPNLTKTQQLNKNRELEQKAFVIFTPQNLQAYYIALAQARKRYQEQNEVSIEGLSDGLMKSKDILNKEPYIQYYYNHFYDIQQLKDKIDQVYELEKAKPYKAYISFGSIWQKKKQVYNHQQTLDEYHYTHTAPNAGDSYKTLSNTVVRDKQTNDYFKQKAVDLLSDYQDPIHEDSSTLMTALYSFLIVVYRLPLGTKMDKICQHFNKEGVTRDIDCEYNICWFIVASFALHPDIDNNKSRVSDAIKLFLQYHDINPSQRLNKANKQLLESYKGFNYVTDLEKYQQIFKLNVITYTCDEMKYKTKNTDVEQFSKFEEHIIDKDYLTTNVLLVPLSLVDEIHAMYISDIDKVINGKLCPNNCQMIFNTKNQNYKRDLARHLKYCQGPETAKQVKLDHLPKPYYPHISNNKLLQKLVATGQSDLLTPTLNYITFDFETVENIINEGNIIAQLEPLSVASAATINDQITTLYFDLRNGSDFIEQWISQLFEVAIKVNEANQSNIPDVTIEDKHQHQHGVIPYKPQVSVIGFNSKKFDMNLLLKHLLKNKTKIQYLGTTTQAKQTIVSHQDYDFDLRFIDILSFIPPNNTLKQFVEKFDTKGIKLTKGVFPHGSFNYDNYKLVLGLTTPFVKEDFYDKLNNKNISDEDYEQYVNDFTSFQDRWEYLKHYNIRDVTCMINPINHLIQITWEEKVNMLGCISLAQIASQIKYKYCYDKFDINASYNIVNGFEQFEVTQYWWNNKVKGYINQDEFAKRDTTNNVTEDDFDWIRDKVANETCHLCHNKFTKENKPTLDRIDNSIGHTKQNCQLACQICNTVKADKDNDISKLKIQLMKYAIYEHLPMTINNESVYNMLKECMQGGLSNVYHKCNLKGVTHTNKLRYNHVTKTITSYDNQYVVTHILDLDFNSLYPSVFSGIFNKNNPYTNNRIYQAGGVTSYFKCTSNSSKQKARDVIMSDDRYTDKGQLFCVKIKGHIDEKHINSHINFAPIWRKLTYNNSIEQIGEFMYNKMKSQGLTVDKPTTKLTALLSTHNQFMCFTNYILWFLIDYCNFIIDDIDSIALFDKHLGFESFACTMMAKRQDAISQHNDTKSLYYKQILNSAFGGEGQNNAKFDKISFSNARQTSLKQLKLDHKATRKLTDTTYNPDGSLSSEAQYMISESPRQFKCNKPLQEAVFTLDNSKFWYLNFVYNFLYKCIDMDRVHFCNMDTDSMYLAIAGSQIEGYKQGLKYVIKDQLFYDQHYKKWLPWDNCTVAEEKKLMGITTESQGENIVCLAPKCYSLYNGNEQNDDIVSLVNRMKGVSEKKANLSTNDYIKCLNDGCNINVTTNNLQMKMGVMSMISMEKSALTGIHNKMVVLSNGCCAPFMYGISADHYLIDQ
ncbi:MAG: hypothetical protein EZS28_022121 [Streblomastix strix]|uniref:DNA-directed DNA polymerase n=1 Tax=Streblomastix strix TaxID=222440 RepID=A0A5J4VIE9_9EUKA|nr:MAG: hypothetical protein EZS28_022121 [Streblomastix strix]